MSICENCNNSLDNLIIFCPTCEYPISGSEKDKSKYLADQILKKSEVEESIGQLKKARIMLFFIGVFNIVIPFLPFFKVNSTQIYVGVIIGSITILFGVLSFKIPKVAFLIPLVIVGLYYLILLFVFTHLFLVGFVWKLFVFSILGYGYFSAKKASKILNENEYLAKKMGFVNK